LGDIEFGDIDHNVIIRVEKGEKCYMWYYDWSISPNFMSHKRSSKLLDPYDFWSFSKLIHVFFSHFSMKLYKEVLEYYYNILYHMNFF